MTKNGLHRFNVTGCRQHLCRQGAPAAVRRPLLDTGLPVEPGDGLLQRITSPVHLRPAVQLAVFERKFKSLPLVRQNQLGTWAKPSVFIRAGKPPAAPMTYRKPRIERGKASCMRKVYVSWTASFRNFSTQVHLWLDGSARVQHICNLQQGQFSDANASGMGEP